MKTTFVKNIEFNKNFTVRYQFIFKKNSEFDFNTVAENSIRFIDTDNIKNINNIIFKVNNDIVELPFYLLKNDTLYVRMYRDDFNEVANFDLIGNTI